MTKTKKILKKIILMSILILLSSLVFINSSNAVTLDAAHVYSIGRCPYLVKYQGSARIVDYVQYDYNGVSYPAYCLDKTKKGADTQGYTVSIEDTIKDVGLWRYIINGYPYKTIEQLGCATKEEAFTATKQALYCYIHGNNINDYEPIGEAGVRTLNAMKQIIANAQNSTETIISNTIQINKNDDNWKQDDIDKNYLSKIFSISADTTITSYHITLSRDNEQDLGGIKLTNLQNQEMSNFGPEEKFKVLIPIKNLTEKREFNLTVETKIETKPVLYGKAPNSVNQDYALVAATYDDGNGSTKDSYPKNETKIVIVKKDDETGEKLANVEFELLDENKNIVYSGLKTNNEGMIEINNIIPGKYYLKETKGIEGYHEYEQLIDFELALHEQITIEVNNTKEEEPEVEIHKTEKTKAVKTKEVKTLPVTGM